MLLSIRKDYSEITQLLLDEGADVNIKEDAFTDKYPKPGSSEIITLKIGGWTALHRVVSRGNLGLIELLLAKGADINARSCEGRTPLHYAIMFSKEADIVEILLANGADVNAKDNKYGQTPLHMAAMNRLDYFKPEAVKLLLAYGADVDSRNKGGATPMYWACALGNVEAAELLLAGGADVNIQTTKHGSTVLHIASGRGYTDLIRSLLAAGADVNIEDNKSRTPLDMAIENGRTGTAKLLKKHGAKTAAELAASDE